MLCPRFVALFRRGAALLCLPAVLLTGCARQSPSKNSLSGRRLRVTMNFRGEIAFNNHYYFLLNLKRDSSGNIGAGDVNAAGPVPVLFPPYGNGFATGPAGASTFTDFIVYDSLQPQGYGLYHVVGDANRSQFTLPSNPVAFVRPDPNDARTARQLQFEIDMSQLVTDAQGNPLTDQAAAREIARAVRFVQINIVATNIVPRDVVTPVDKRVDSLGETGSPSGSNNPGAGTSAWLTLDVSQIGRVYNNAAFVGQSISEPSSPDLFGGDDPSLDLVDWSVEVRDVG